MRRFVGIRRLIAGRPVPSVRERRPKSRRGSSLPVGAQGRGLTFKVQDNNLGQKLPVPPVPLQGKLDVGASCVAVFERVLSQVVPVVVDRRAMEELEKPDRYESVNLRDPARAHRKLGVKPVPALMSMIIPCSGILFEPLPLFPAGEITAVGPIDRALVEVGPLQIRAELARQDDIRVEVEYPVMSSNLIEARAESSSPC